MSRSGRIQALLRTWRRFNGPNCSARRRAAPGFSCVPCGYGEGGLTGPHALSPSPAWQGGCQKYFPASDESVGAGKAVCGRPSRLGSQILQHLARGAVYGTQADATARLFYFSSVCRLSCLDVSVRRTPEVLARAKLWATLPWSRLRSVPLRYAKGSPFCQHGVNLKIRSCGLLWGKAGLTKKEKQLPSARRVFRI